MSLIDFSNFAVQDINIQTNHENPQVLIVADAPSNTLWQRGDCIAPKHLEMVQSMLGSAWKEGVAIVSPCAPIPDEIYDNERKENEHLTAYRPQFHEALSYFQPKVIVCLGKFATRQLAARSVKITQARGSFKEYDASGTVPVMSTFSPSHVFQRLQVKPIVEADLAQVSVLADMNWQMQSINTMQGLHYEWCLDLTPLLDAPPSSLCLDTETKGLTWWNRRRVLTTQISTGPGKGLMIPMDLEYFNNQALRGETTKHLPLLTQRHLDKLIKQQRQLLDMEIAVTGHHLKFDLHHLRNYGIEVRWWYFDTLQGAFCLDENMQAKNLDECVRRWVTPMAGYADKFNDDPIHNDKQNMERVPHDDMLMYGCGDVDAGIRLARFMIPEIKKDARQWNCLERIQMPGLRTFFLAEERGIMIDKDALVDLGEHLREREQREYAALMQEAVRKAPAVCRKHAEKGLKFSRPDFVRDLLFTPDGWNLVPVVATKKTKKLAAEEQLESTSAKDHLPFFDHIPFVGGRVDAEGNVVHGGLIKYQKLNALLKNFIGGESTVEWVRQRRLKNGGYGKPIHAAYEAAGYEVPVRKMPKRIITPIEDEPEMPIVREFRSKGITWGEDAKGNVYRQIVEEAKGYHQYLEEGDPDAIHTSFSLSTAVTGRSSSSNPNCQNWSNRGDDAKLFRSIFVARPGHVLIEADESQAELRVAAVMFNEPTMLRIYREGGDIHTYTAQKVLGISPAQWDRMDKGLRKEARQQAKAVNFGYLYGMWWKKFRDYAKTNYNVTITDRQAEQNRQNFFRTYGKLETGHAAMRKLVHRQKYVRSLHGALRRLPMIDSVEDFIQQEAERQAINSPVQRFASDLGIMAMTRFMRDADHERMMAIGFIHDAVVIEAKEEAAEEAASAIKWYMENQPLQEWFSVDFPIPMVSDIKIGHKLGAMEERADVVAICPAWYQADLDAA